MKTHKYLIRILVMNVGVLLLLFSSCGPAFYTPTSPTLPGFRYRDEVQFIVGGGENDVGAESIHLSGAWAFDSSFSAAGSITALNGGDVDTRQGYYGNAVMADFSLGHFGSIAKTRWSYELMAGCQFGQATVYEYENHMVYNFSKPYVMADVNVRTRYFDFLYFIKGGYFAASNLNMRILNSSSVLNEGFYRFMEAPFMATFEHGFSIRAGYKGIKMQGNIFFLTDMMPNGRNWSYGAGGLTFGLHVDLNWLLQNGKYPVGLFTRPNKR